jgi:NSS family neurotransmitter:Na+ symporter
MASILTMLGVSIGLGNVWRFPYMMGKYGGSAFLLVYLGFTLLFAFPALMAEMALGRRSGKGTIDALRLSFGKTGTVLGFGLMIVISISGAYYAAVIGNVFYTTLFAAWPGFSEDHSGYQAGLSNGWLQYGLTAAVILASIEVIRRGIVNGIERISKLVMPLFFIALVYMIVRAWMMPGAIEASREFLKPDWSALGAPELFAALGQAFFSVGLGGTFVVVYAGFMPRQESLPKVALATGLGDASASLLFSLFLVPSVLALGLSMDSGPSLIFETLPRLFNVMPGGRLVGFLFLSSIAIVAFLSLVAAYQVPFTSLQNEFPALKRTHILVAIAGSQLLLSLPCNLFPSIIAPLDLIFGSGMQVLGSGICIIGLTWGFRREDALEEILNTTAQPPIYRVVFFWIRWFIPLSLAAVLVNYVLGILG